MLRYASETLTCLAYSGDTAYAVDGKKFEYCLYKNETTGEHILLVDYATTSSGSIGSKLCVDAGQDYDITTLDGFSHTGCVFPASMSQSSVTIKKDSAMSLTSGASPISNIRITIYRYDTPPVLLLEDPAFLGSYDNPITWTLLPGDDRVGGVTAMTVYYRTSETNDWIEAAQFTDTLKTEWSYRPKTTLGYQYYITAEYRTFASGWDGVTISDFRTLNRKSTGICTVTRKATTPETPNWLITGILTDGGKVNVRWEEVIDPLYPIASYTLERAVGTADATPDTFVTLYSGESTEFRDQLPVNIQSVVYRVCCYNSLGNVSAWYTTSPMPVVRSNVYVGQDGAWVRAAKLYVGSHPASARIYVDGKI